MDCPHIESRRTSRGPAFRVLNYPVKSGVDKDSPELTHSRLVGLWLDQAVRGISSGSPGGAAKGKGDFQQGPGGGGRCGR